MALGPMYVPCSHLRALGTKLTHCGEYPEPAGTRGPKSLHVAPAFHKNVPGLVRVFFRCQVK